MPSRRTSLLLLLAGSSLLFLWSLWLAANQTMGSLEQTVFHTINSWPNVLRLPFLVITYSGTVYMMGAVVLLLIWRRYFRLALRVFLGVGAAFLATQAVKLMVQRPRPYDLLSGVYVRERLAAGFGYPSTHTAVATVMALLLVIWLPHKWRWLAVAWIVLVGLSRIYLGVHAPLDIVGGFSIGVMIVVLSLLIPNKLMFVRKITRMKLSD